MKNSSRLFVHVVLGSIFLPTVNAVHAASTWVEPKDDAQWVIAKKGPAAKTFKPEANEEKNPLGCRNLGYQFELKTLKIEPGAVGEKQSLYFVYNKRPESVHLYQMLQDDSTRDYFLNTAINSHQWAVLSTSEQHLKYICTVDDAKLTYGKIVDCADSVNVCEYANVKYGLNNKGNFWLVKGNTRGGAVYDVLHYGIIPR